MKPLLSAFCLLAILSACNNAEKSADTATADSPTSNTFNLAAAKDSIAAMNAAFASAMKAGDSVGVAAVYTSDAILMPANMPAFKGHNEILSFAGEAVRANMGTFKLESTEVYGNDEMLQEVGVYTISDDKGTAVDKGKYIVLWKKEGGRWKMFRDVFNSDNPPHPDQIPKK
jgi:ketosteroid isomerase-like protein